MVNEKPSSKHKILEILRSSTLPVNGDAIAKETGISRVAVWKAIQSLELSGYKIDSTRNGYLLKKDLEDSLFPWEFEGKESSYFHFTETDSTMIQGRIEAEKSSAGDLKIVTADVQKKGKGHADHKWTTTKGSLACTFVLKEKIPLAENHRFLMACQIAAAKTLQSHGKEIFLRWPNDIWTKAGKAGGILDDLSATGSWTNWVNLGLGLNLSSKPKLEGTDCIFSTKEKILRKDILKEIINNFKEEIQIAKLKDSQLEKQWNLFCPDVNKKIRIKESGTDCVFKGINSYGWAIKEMEGKEKLFPPCTINFQKNGGN